MQPGQQVLLDEHSCWCSHQAACSPRHACTTQHRHIVAAAVLHHTSCPVHVPVPVSTASVTVSASFILFLNTTNTTSPPHQHHAGPSLFGPPPGAAQAAPNQQPPQQQPPSSAPPPYASAPPPYGGAPPAYNAPPQGYAPSPAYPPAAPPGKRKAVLVGCTYPGTNAALNGCINDVNCIKHLLTGKLGYQSQDIVVLKDDVQHPDFFPTKANIWRAIQWLMTDVRPGDHLFFHFSGHGSQRRDRWGQCRGRPGAGPAQ
jgi:hypothetical protein